MKLSKLLPHLIGAVAILNAPAMVSPASTAEIERLNSATQEMKRLRDYPNTMSPTELVAWRSQAANWLAYWISLLESFDLKRMSESSNKNLAHQARMNIQMLEHLILYRDLHVRNSQFAETMVPYTAHIIYGAVHTFDIVIVPIGMDIEKIGERFTEGGKLSIEGLHHSFSVNQYFYEGYGPPKW